MKPKSSFLTGCPGLTWTMPNHTISSEDKPVTGDAAASRQQEIQIQPSTEKTR
jgi:hypothetical protein